MRVYVRVRDEAITLFLPEGQVLLFWRTVCPETRARGVMLVHCFYGGVCMDERLGRGVGCGVVVPITFYIECLEYIPYLAGN